MLKNAHLLGVFHVSGVSGGWPPTVEDPQRASVIPGNDGLELLPESGQLVECGRSVKVFSEAG